MQDQQIESYSTSQGSAQQQQQPEPQPEEPIEGELDPHEDSGPIEPPGIGPGPQLNTSMMRMRMEQSMSQSQSVPPGMSEGQSMSQGMGQSQGMGMRMGMGQSMGLGGHQGMGSGPTDMSSGMGQAHTSPPARPLMGRPEASMMTPHAGMGPSDIPGQQPEAMEPQPKKMRVFIFNKDNIVCKSIEVTTQLYTFKLLKLKYVH